MTVLSHPPFSSKMFLTGLMERSALKRGPACFATPAEFQKRCGKSSSIIGSYFGETVSQWLLRK